MASAADLVTRLTLKPPSSIPQPMPTVDLTSGEASTLSVKGRHDPVLAPRGVAVVEAVTVLVLTDLRYVEVTSMNNRWTVHKFGGSVLRGAPDLDRLADRMAEDDGPAAIVVSALWGTTDRLLRAVDDPRYAERLVSDLRSHHLMFAPRLDRGRDGSRFEHVLETMEEALHRRRADPTDDAARIQLLASGERLSALVIAHHLRRCGFPAHAVGAEDIGMMLSGTQTADAVDLDKARNISTGPSSMASLSSQAGWVLDAMVLALLGRGGSDHGTAVAHLRVHDASSSGKTFEAFILSTLAGASTPNRSLTCLTNLRGRQPDRRTGAASCDRWSVH